MSTERRDVYVTRVRSLMRSADTKLTQGNFELAEDLLTRATGAVIAAKRLQLDLDEAVDAAETKGEQ